MDKCSYFIPFRAIFGSFPTQETVELLEKDGVRYFFDLTEEKEKLTPYRTNYNYVNFPIPDRDIPRNWFEFVKFIVRVSNIIERLEEGEKIYLHCKGGHGRSGVVVACVLCYLFKMKPDMSLYLTNKYHNERPTMREIWRKMGSPQTAEQRAFVCRFFTPIYFTNDVFNFLSTFSNYTIRVENVGVFPTLESAYQAHKNLENKEYVEVQMNSKSGRFSKIEGRMVQLTYPNWEESRVDIMYKLLRMKFDQNPELKIKLAFTGLRPLVYYSKSKSFWSNSGENMLGVLLEKVRRELLSS